MGIYKRKLDAGAVIEADSVFAFTADGIEIIQTPWPSIEDGVEVQHESTTHRLTKTELLYDNVLGREISGSHIVVFVGFKTEETSTTAVVVEQFAHTTLSKTSKIGKQLGAYNLMQVFIPFTDTDMSEWTYVVTTGGLTHNGVEITDELDTNLETSIAAACEEFLPDVTLAMTNGVLTAQLVDGANKAPLAKAGVEIYLENTTGVLGSVRLTTDANGQATTTLTGAESGKVKAGFKYFSGKAELIL